jgi:hypothetical protein
MKVFIDGDISTVQFSKKEGSVFEYQAALDKLKQHLDDLETVSTPDFEF